MDDNFFQQSMKCIIRKHYPSSKDRRLIYSCDLENYKKYNLDMKKNLVIIILVNTFVSQS
jgi:hypothetical protein